MTLVLLLVTTPAWAEWVKGHEDYQAVVYIDPASICKDGDRCRVLVMYDLKAPGASGELSISALHEFDCKEARWRILDSSFHSGPMGTDKIIRSDTVASGSPIAWNYPIPDTVPDSLLKFLCPHPKFIIIAPPALAGLSHCLDMNGCFAPMKTEPSEHR